MKGEREEYLWHIVHFSCRLLSLNLFPVVYVSIFQLLRHFTAQSNEDGREL